MCKFSTKGSKCQMPFPSLHLLYPLPLLLTFFCSSAGASVPSISNCWHASARSAICPLPRPLSPRPVAYFSAHAILMPIASARTHRVDPTTPPASAPLLYLYLCSLPFAPCPLHPATSPVAATTANFMSSKNINQQSFFRVRIPRSKPSCSPVAPLTLFRTPNGVRTVRLQQDVV